MSGDTLMMQPSAIARRVSSVDKEPSDKTAHAQQKVWSAEKKKRNQMANMRDPVGLSRKHRLQKVAMLVSL